MKKVRLSILHRKPRKNANFSLESYFMGVYQRLPENIDKSFYESKYESKGVFYRLYNMIEAAFRQGDVNHVTGDVHFLTYFLKKSKTILTIHDLGNIHALSGIRRRVFTWLWFSLPIYKSRYITVVSEATKQDLLSLFSWIPAEKVQVIPVFVDSQYQPNHQKFNSIKPVLLQIGTKPNKNIPRLLAAIEGIPCTLIIIGKLSEDLIVLLNKHNISYENFVGITNEELLNQYHRCDIVTFVSTLEGFGMPIIEANMVGRPIITSNIASMPEVGGNAVCLADPYDVASIRAGILRLIEDPQYREQLIQNGYENAQRYNAEVIVSQYVKLYHQIA